MVKPPCCDKNKMQHWTEEEDTKALSYAQKQGTGNWTAMPKKAGLRRCGKSCRVRWSTGNQRPDPVHQTFTPEEEDLIIKLHAAIGSRWSIIAQQLPGRTDNDVKNIWNVKLKKKLSAIGIDPVTHRPFSQILADYGNMGGFPKARTRFGCLSRDIKNAFVMKPEQSDHHIPHRQRMHSYFNSHFETAISPPAIVEPSKQHFFSNNHQSLELLSQLQAITMVTDASNYTNITTISSAKIPTECSSSSASSSSPESPPSATNQAIASPSFSWCDFLLEDAFLPTNNVQEEQENALRLPHSSDGLKSKEKHNSAAAKEEMDIPMQTVESSTLPSGSFVEAMLEGENEMLSDFNGLLEEPFYY